MTANEGAYAIGKRGATGTIILLLGRERCLRNVVGAHVRVQLCHRHLRHLDSRTRKLLPRATVKEPVGPPGVQDLGPALRMRIAVGRAMFRSRYSYSAPRVPIRTRAENGQRKVTPLSSVSSRLEETAGNGGRRVAPDRERS